ncbi:YraN family protein [Rickettsia endosymbiont of Cardiosporidium cionae]|uniref:YraN family protein n=1 Tax=Rickettsia endosymbiont of Cardiosporidium cionae TaxID=2777155 RepID=UPI00189336B6|nr:YraN family protein [Rickettsia endosymbiont of Cardiosporidium cionae]KAF8818270.1 hypothetical protein IHI24_000729 [Rickettsia endosymbiont of Cardiosporidium cionae]
MDKLSNNKIGIISEYFVIFCYKFRFYKILSHRFRSYTGEIDIVAVKSNVIVFIEVKFRKYLYDYNIISTYQKRRIQNSAKVFVASNEFYSSFDMRFDLVIVRPYNFPIFLENIW